MTRAATLPRQPHCDPRGRGARDQRPRTALSLCRPRRRYRNFQWKVSALRCHQDRQVSPERFPGFKVIDGLLDLLVHRLNLSKIAGDIYKPDTELHLADQIARIPWPVLPHNPGVVVLRD